MDTPAGLPSRHEAAAVRAGEDGLSALSRFILCIEPELSPAPKPLVVAPESACQDKADPAASRGQTRSARALREQRSRSSCSFAMAASMSRPAASLPRRRARRRRAAAPPWQHGARRCSPPRRQTSPTSGTGQPPSDPTPTPIPDLLAPPPHAHACLVERRREHSKRPARCFFVRFSFNLLPIQFRSGSGSASVYVHVAK